MRRKRQQSTGASSSANSLRNLAGMPSSPGALFILREQRTLQTLHVEMMSDGIGLERGKVGGSKALESLMVELEEKMEPKSVALSVGE